MSNAPFTDNIDPQDLKTFQTYFEVQSMMVASIRKENTRLKIENEQLKRANYRDMTTEQIYEDLAEKPEPVPEAVKRFVIYVANHESMHLQVLLSELRGRVDKLEKRESHEYEGSERWSPENGDEVYRDGEWVKVTSRSDCPTCGNRGAY